MADDASQAAGGPPPDAPEAFDFSRLPDHDREFVGDDDIAAFVEALSVPDFTTSQDDLDSPRRSPFFITALNDWKPVRQRVRRRRRRRRPRRGTDETREGFVYALLKWPLLVSALGWLALLALLYGLTRTYIYLYEHNIAWTGQRQRLRKIIRQATTYDDWKQAAESLDTYLGNEAWKREPEYAYYDSGTVSRVRTHMCQLRERAEQEEPGHGHGTAEASAIEELQALVEACVKDNFAGIENPRLYSETYHGTKEMVQCYVDEVQRSLSLLLYSKRLSIDDKKPLFRHLYNNFGRSALCLSGGATFAYYHFGVAKAMLDANVLPEVITGTSGGALVAALLGTRTDEELRRLLVPALANRITACHDDTWTWLRRWWRTGARFDSVDWARRCSWFTRGSMTFREAYSRTGRILNVTCVPSDPYSPTILANYLTSPDCVIWSAVLASAAVPGILNPVVLMKKQKNGRLAAYSFGHKWKDGSLRTDIPLKALNLHFNVNFSIVSQVNPHINLFFFSSRGAVGRPVTHRRGRGWRGGFLGSALEQYFKLEMTKWLKVLRHLELLPRPLGQDWSEVWLQKFSGTITIWPRSVPADFLHILSDPSPTRLARMIHQGQHGTFPKLNFIRNRMAIERLIEQGRRLTRSTNAPGLAQVLSEEDLRGLLSEFKKRDRPPATAPAYPLSSDSSGYSSPARPLPRRLALSNRPAAHDQSASIGGRLSEWWNKASASASASPHAAHSPRPVSMFEIRSDQASHFYAPKRRSGVFEELRRQSRVFIDDDDDDDDDDRALFSDDDDDRPDFGLVGSDAETDK